MANNKQQLEASSFRECAFYIDYLMENFEDTDLDDINEFDTIDACLDMIRKEVNYHTEDEKKSGKLIGQMQTDFKAQQLRDDDFLWLGKSDERFCNWVWCYLKSKSKQKRNRNRRENNKVEPILDIDDLLLDKSVSYTNLSSNAFRDTSNNTHDRRKDIIKSFHASELRLTKQKEVIEALLNSWKPIFSDKKIVKWLEENNTHQYEWTWEYLNKFDDRLSLKAWTPTNDNELKNAIVALFDMLHDKPDRKTLLLGSMKRAWSQKKFRDKNEGKKAYSISMTEKTKQQLDSLAEQKRLKINETIEILIRNEFERLKD
ncbi:hypothetical protein [Vibrio sp. 10N.237.312.B06]|uniref:hypothetical protein n=1 Tax=Vibrio sp. 10N.237.312.B06 TaxID=3229974 RepID=UPI00354D88ED